MIQNDRNRETERDQESKRKGKKERIKSDRDTMQTNRKIEKQRLCGEKKRGTEKKRDRECVLR